MAYFIKPGFWDKARKAPKEWLNILDVLKGNSKSSFTGELDLGNPAGTYYPKTTQTGAISLSATDVGRTGGAAFISIVANGDSIIVPDSWVLISSDGISTNSGDTNHIGVFVMHDGAIHYGNKVETA